MIPLIDLSLEESLKREIKRAIDAVIDSKSYILGKHLETLEEEFASFIGAKFAIGAGSGTDALRLCLRALGIGHNDKILTVAFTSPFTSVAIIEEGAIPVYCDVSEKTWTIDIDDARKKIDKDVRAIIPVHIYGSPCDMTAILKFARQNNLKVIEDACQAHGATISGKKVGVFGDATAFSFYPTKNLGAMGDGGMVTTNNERLAAKIKILRHGGQIKRFWHEYAGINSRLDEIQAAILEIRLRSLEADNKKREILAKRYIEAFADLPLSTQSAVKGGSSAWHLFVVRTNKRDRLKNFLAQEGIISDIYYPYPLNKQPAFGKLNQFKLKITENLCREILAIPIYPRLSFKDQDYVIKRIREFFGKE